MNNSDLQDSYRRNWCCLLAEMCTDNKLWNVVNKSDKLIEVVNTLIHISTIWLNNRETVSLGLSVMKRLSNIFQYKRIRTILVNSGIIEVNNFQLYVYL